MYLTYLFSNILFQIALTCLELFSDYGKSMSKWPVWAKFFNELNNILLVSYSALNPLAYCGELVFKTICHYFKRSNQIPQQRNGIIISNEYGDMKSIGITLNGPDPLEKQLEELDAQSRLMCGLSRSS